MLVGGLAAGRLERRFGSRALLIARQRLSTAGAFVLLTFARSDAAGALHRLGAARARHRPRDGGAGDADRHERRRGRDRRGGRASTTSRARSAARSAGSSRRCCWCPIGYTSAFAVGLVAMVGRDRRRAARWRSPQRRSSAPPATAAPGRRSVLSHGMVTIPDRRAATSRRHRRVHRARAQAARGGQPRAVRPPARVHAHGRRARRDPDRALARDAGRGAPPLDRGRLLQAPVPGGRSAAASCSNLAMAVVREHLAKRGPGLHAELSHEASVVANQPLVLVLHEYGTEEQKRSYMDPLANGEIELAFGLTEPNHGSDATWLETTAETATATTGSSTAPSAGTASWTSPRRTSCSRARQGRSARPPGSARSSSPPARPAWRSTTTTGPSTCRPTTRRRR